MPRIPLPAADEFAPYYGRYISQLPGDDVLAALESQAISTAKLLAATPESLAGHRYEPGKWSVREVVGHIADAERVFAYRALRFGRGDTTPLPGFDENVYVPGGRFERRTLADVAAEFASVRQASLTLFRSFDEPALVSRGTASGHPVSVRALAAIAAGHELHHVKLLRERYGLTG
jgi:hypothetical protein